MNGALSLLIAKDSELSFFGRVARWSLLAAALWVAACFGLSLLN